MQPADVTLGPGTGRTGEPYGQPARSGNGGPYGGDYERRLTRIETRMEAVALREDVLRLKLWILGGVIAGMIIALGIGLAIARLYLTTPTN